MNEKLRNSYKQASDYLSLNNTVQLRALLALTILACHLFALTKITFSINLLNWFFHSFLGYIPVSVFFFLSGYGLMFSFGRKENYLKTYYRNRVAPFYVNYVVLIVIYTLIKFVFYKEFDVLLLIKSFFFSETVVKFGWYFQTQLVLYLLFYVSFRFAKTNKIRILVLSILLLLCIVIAYIVKLEQVYYASTPTFLLGVIWGSGKVDKFLKQKSRYLMLLALPVLTGGAWVACSFFGTYIQELLKQMSSSVFITAFIIILMSVLPKHLNSRVLKFLGDISFEIYGFQGAVILIASYFTDKFSAPLLLLMFVLVIAVSAAVHPLFNRLDKLIKKQ